LKCVKGGVLEPAKPLNLPAYTEVLTRIDRIEDLVVRIQVPKSKSGGKAPQSKSRICSRITLDCGAFPPLWFLVFDIRMPLAEKLRILE
jgi:hypothetical protein